MARLKTIPDTEVYATICALLAAGGDKAVAFAAVARATGLAAPTLVQRFGTRDKMLELALAASWDAMDAATLAAEASAEAGPKGAQALLKALGAQAEVDLALLAVDFRDAGLRERAAAWRARVEAALASRLGDAEAAALLFAAWQGQLLWRNVGGKGFRLKDAIKRISG